MFRAVASYPGVSGASIRRTAPENDEGGAIRPAPPCLPFGPT
jgi:hypothetical protein